MQPALAAGAPRRQRPAHVQAEHRQPGARGRDAGRATGESLDAVALRAYVADRFDQIELAARWLGQRERDRAERMVDKLLRWLADNPREQLAIEQEFAIRLEPRDDGAGRAAARAGSTGSSSTSEGRLVVVDLKTGASVAERRGRQGHPQLAAYQVAVEAGAFERGHASPAARRSSARHVAPGAGRAGAAAAVRGRGPDVGGRRWSGEAAAAMAASTFRAVVNESCRVCAVRTSCPISGKGRQVTVHDELRPSGWTPESGRGSRRTSSGGGSGLATSSATSSWRSSAPRRTSRCWWSPAPARARPS